MARLLHLQLDLDGDFDRVRRRGADGDRLASPGTQRRATVLLDCGMFQGRRQESRQRNLELGLRRDDVDAVVLSHAHIDHSGALPILCRSGYTGPIYATPATRDLCAVMLEDAAMIQAADARYLNRKIEREHVDAEPIAPALRRRRRRARARPDDRGALPPSAAHRRRASRSRSSTPATCSAARSRCSTWRTTGETKRIVFTGDLGRHDLPILRDPEMPERRARADHREHLRRPLHPAIEQMDDELAAVLNRTYARGGKVVIPSFALERAQEVVYSLKKLRGAGRIPAMPVYVDSPLTVNITEVFRLHPECYDAEARRLLTGGDSPFEFEGLRYTASVEESAAIHRRDEPCVIISASGMCEAGRVLHHLRATVEDAKNTVVIVGFQAQHTLGRRIVERRPRIRIFGVERRLAAEVVVMNGFSAHADQNDLLAFAEARARARSAAAA